MFVVKHVVKHVAVGGRGVWWQKPWSAGRRNEASMSAAEWTEPGIMLQRSSGKAVGAANQCGQT
jgi:hypothetical protein